jgi:transposase
MKSNEIKKIYLGIDVHKKTWVLHFVSEHVVLKRISMNEPSAEKVHQIIKQNYPDSVVKCAYEAGFSGFWLQEQLTSLGIETIIVHPGDIPTTDKEKRFKTDKIDAKKIAMSLRSGMLEGIAIPPKQIQRDRNMVRARYQIAKDERRVKHRIRSHMNFYGFIESKDHDKYKYWSRNTIKEIEAIATENKDEVLKYHLEKLKMERSQLLNQTRKLRAMSRSDRYQDSVELLMSIPGVGLLTIMVFLTEMWGIARFKTDDQYMSYIGLVPTSNSSGERERRGGISKRGNKQLRTSIVLAAWSSIRHNAEMLSRYEELRSNGKTGNKAIIKIAKKLALIMKAVIRDNKKYVVK